MASLSEDEILNIIRDEKTRATGFEGDGFSSELQAERQRALEYYKGDISSDLPSLENRSSAVSKDVADQIEQVLPSLVEIFLDEDVAAFVPTSDQDVPAAEQETDFVNHVVFKQNNGFELLNTVFKDALLLKTGYFMWYWEPADEPEEEDFENIAHEDLLNALATNPDRVLNVVQNEDGTFNFTIVAEKKEGKLCIKSWMPEDVGVSQDTTKLGNGTYCGFRSRVRRQELLADGYDPDLVADIPEYGNNLSPIAMARDTAMESQFQGGGSEENMDMVQITYNYVRVLQDDDLKLYHVITAGDADSVVLKIEEVDEVPASMVTPFPIPHRFFGESLADKLLAIQRQKSAIMRIGFDHAYFSMNNRIEVSEGGVMKHTLSDIMNNVPGAPIRTKTPGFLNPISPGGLSFDWLSSLEYLSTQAEQATGVMRSAMGLNPDALHDTKGGMLAMMNQGQLRVRYMARIFAETGVKDMFLGVHKMLRQNSSVGYIVRLKGQHVAVNPASWALREDMDIEIGNAGGRDYDIATMQQVMGIHEKAIQAQQGIDGPLTSPKYQLATAERLMKRMGIKNTNQYLPSPNDFMQQQAQQGQQGPQPTPPDPNLLKMQHDAQMAEQQLQFEQMKAQASHQLEQAKAEADIALKREQIQYQGNIELQKAQIMAATRQDQVNKELELNAQIKQLEARLEAIKLQKDDENQKMAMALDHHASMEGLHQDAQKHQEGLIQDAAKHDASLMQDHAKHIAGLEFDINLGGQRPGGNADK